MLHNIRCFVAMSFDRPDADAIFIVMKRALRPLGIIPRRVDRIEHNDNIDQRIIKELTEADLVIADLTYARPSVYFEAGYAQRSIPVVYTVRKDHFKPRPDDKFGNFRIHFDVQNRNIIDWSSPTDKRFPGRLKCRVSKVIAPLLREKHKTLERAADIAAFEKLSLRDKYFKLYETAAEYFRSIGYDILDVRNNDISNAYFHLHSQMEQGAFAAVKHSGRTFHIVYCQVAPSVTTRLAEAYNMLWVSPIAPYKSGVFKDLTALPDEVREDILLVSLGTAGLNRLRRVIPTLHAGTFEGSLAREIPYARDSKAPHLMRQIVFHVIESPARLVRLTEILRERFALAPSVAASTRFPERVRSRSRRRTTIAVG